LGRPLLGLLLRFVPATGIKVSRGRVKVIIVFLAHLHRLYKSNGLSFVVKTMKGYSVIMQQSIGGQKLPDLTPLGVRFSRTKGNGFPRCIPQLDRKKIRMGDKRVIRFWLTLFSIYRVLQIPGKLNLNTITDPGSVPPCFLADWSVFVSG
jgi:hypothetical protein